VVRFVALCKVSRLSQSHLVRIIITIHYVRGGVGQAERGVVGILWGVGKGKGMTAHVVSVNVRVYPNIMVLLVGGALVVTYSCSKMGVFI